MCRTKLQPYGWRVIFNHRQKVLLNSLFWLTRWSQVRSSCHVSLESTCLAVILHLTSCWILSFVTFVVICCWLVLEKCVANRSGDCLYSGWSSIYPKSCLLHPECLSYTSKFWLDFRIFFTVYCCMIMNHTCCNYTSYMCHQLCHCSFAALWWCLFIDNRYKIV